MPDIAALVQELDMVAESGNYRILGHVSVVGTAGDAHPFSVEINFNATALQVNQAIIAAAIAVAEAEENVTVGALDKKTLHGGAVAL